MWSNLIILLNAVERPEPVNNIIKDFLNYAPEDSGEFICNAKEDSYGIYYRYCVLGDKYYLFIFL